MLADFPNGGTLPDGTGAITISRPDLYSALRDEVVKRGVRIEHGKRLVHAEETGGGVRARFADGIHSAVVWWFANPPRADDPGPQRLAAISSDEWRAQLLESFAEDASPAQALIRHTEHIIASVSTYDMPVVSHWHTDRMVIIGDAAHAVSPSAGQGASMSIEDAVTLGKCLRDIPEVAPALASYEGLRRDRVQRVVAQGRSNDRGKTGGPVVRFFRDLFMPVATRRMFRDGRDPFWWIWSHHIDWDEPISPPATLSGQRPG